MKKKLLLISSLDFSHFGSYRLSLVLLSCTSVTNLALSSQECPCRYPGRIRSPSAISFWGCISLIPSTFPHRPSAPSTDDCGDLPLNSLSLPISSLFWGAKTRHSILHMILKVLSKGEKSITSISWLCSHLYNSGGGFWPSTLPGCPAGSLVYGQLAVPQGSQVFSAELLPSHSSPAYRCKGFLLSRWRTLHLSLLNFIYFLPTHSCCPSRCFWMTVLIPRVHWLCFLGQYHLQTLQVCIFILWFCTSVQINFILVHYCTDFAAYKSRANLVTSGIAVAVGRHWASLSAWSQSAEINRVWEELRSSSAVYCWEQVVG